MMDCKHEKRNTWHIKGRGMVCADCVSEIPSCKHGKKQFYVNDSDVCCWECKKPVVDAWVILTKAQHDKMNAVVEAVNSYMQFYDLAENMFFPHPSGEGIMAERRKKLYLALTALEGE